MSSKASIVDISLEEAFNLPLYECFFVVDARPLEAYQSGHLVTARSFPPAAEGKEAPSADFKQWLSTELSDNGPERTDIFVAYGEKKDRDELGSHLSSVVFAHLASHPGVKQVLCVREGYAAFAARFPFLTTTEQYPDLIPYPCTLAPFLAFRVFISAPSFMRPRERPCSDSPSRSSSTSRASASVPLKSEMRKKTRSSLSPTSIASWTTMTRKRRPCRSERCGSRRSRRSGTRCKEERTSSCTVSRASHGRPLWFFTL